MTSDEFTCVARRREGWRRPHRAMYDWVLRWADTPHGVAALFVLAFAESSVFPIPPDVLLIALVVGSLHKWRRFALVCTLGSVLGGMAGYAIGAGLMDTLGARILALYHAEQQFERVRSLYVAYDYWMVLIAAFTPIPYKVFTIASGAFGMEFAGFVGASFIGRGLRFFLVAGLLRLFGKPLRALIERYFDILSLAFVILLVAGFLVIKWAS